MVLRRNQRTRPPARSVPPSCLTLPACLSVCVSIHTSVYLSLEWISALPLRDCLHHHLSYAHYVYLIWYSFPQQVASVAKGVTARGVAAAAGAGLGIGFRGDPASAAKQAELLTQREYYAKQLEHLNSMRERGESSVGRCNPIRSDHTRAHASCSRTLAGST